jgi:hypothetical protein
MTRDPIQPLADIGRRVLQTVQYLAKPQVQDQPLESYKDQVQDPLVTLSNICNELLDQIAAAPAAAEPENLPSEPGSRFVPAPNQGSDFPTFSHAGVARIPTDGSDEATDSRRENQAMEWSGTVGAGLDFTSPFEEVRRSIDSPAPLPGEPRSRDPREAATSREHGRSAPQTENPAAPLRPAIDGYDPPARQAARYTPRSRDMKLPAESFPTDERRVGEEGELSPEERSSDTRPPVRHEGSEASLSDLPSDARASDLPVRAENGSARGTGEAEAPLQGSRLTGSTERLAAILRSHVAQPESVTRVDVTESKEGEDVFSRRQGDDERDTSRIDVQPVRTDGPASVEEIMERLADELETEFVRTYGSSGG